MLLIPVYLYYRHAAKARLPVRPAPIVAESSPQSPSPAADGPAPPASPAILPGVGAGGDITMPDGAVPLATLPADLPLHAGGKKLLSFERREGAMVDQQGVWSIPGLSPAAALDYYQQAAEQRGFTPVAAANPAVSRVLTRGDQQLFLRATSSAPGVRLTVIFRYTDRPTR